MHNKHIVGKIFLLIIAAISCAFVATGCAKQVIDLSSVQQGIDTTNVKHFKTSSYTVYMLLDLITVSPAKVDQMLSKVNPENKPIINLKVTSEADILATLVNILNGGVIDRGVIVSLNKVTVEGDIIQ